MQGNKEKSKELDEWMHSLVNITQSDVMFLSKRVEVIITSIVISALQILVGCSQVR